MVAATVSLAAQANAPAPPIHKVRDGVYLVGAVQVDTTKKELSVPGLVNSDVATLEFVANTQGGAKAYESAITVMTNAVTFNTALLLLGLDPAHAKKPTHHFDAAAPKGDPVEIWIEWKQRDVTHRERIEELLLDTRTNRAMAPGSWVYTGSTFMDKQFMADMDGVLIGFVHSPSPVIENQGSGAVDAYGSIVLNTHLPMDRGTQLTLIVKVLPIPKK